jgi:mevalonate kinase
MLLQLDERFRVTTDSSLQNFLLEQLQDIKDKSTKEVVRQDWIIIGYHGNSMRSVLMQYMKTTLINSNLEVINDVLDKLKEVEKTIEKVAKKENIKMIPKKNKDD